MRVGRLFAVSMLSVTALAAVLGAGIVVPQYRTVASKSQAIKAVDAYGAVLAVGQQVAGHRAPYLSPLFQDGAATPAQLEAIAKAVHLADAAFIRAATDRALGVPLSARDTTVVKGFLPGVAQVIAIVEPLLNRLENQVTAADASLTALSWRWVSRSPAIARRI